jgi:hypothetical protein
MYGSRGWCVPVRCPNCDVERWCPLRSLRRWVATGFTGLCRPCSLPLARKRWEEMLRRKPQAAIHLTSAGYRAVPLHAVPEEHHWIWQALRNKANAVLEHRLVYSIFLGRPLRSDECVDHLNGVKTDNRIENLRLYVKGRNDPGSGCGHGTYYDEWQRAEARLRALEKRAAEFEAKVGAA